MTDQQPPDRFARARAQRDAAAALRAQARQAQSQARSLREASNAILDSARAIVKETLERREIQLAEPVAARFRSDEHGSTGIEIAVRVKDPARAAAAEEALAEHFGGRSRCDRLIVT